MFNSNKVDSSKSIFTNAIKSIQLFLRFESKTLFHAIVIFIRGRKRETSLLDYSSISNHKSGYCGTDLSTNHISSIVE